MLRSYVVRLYPNKQQKLQIINTFGCARFIYNYYLAKRIEVYAETSKAFFYEDCSRDLTALKKTLPWLRKVDKCALQNSLRDLDNAFRRFFKRICEFPVFKKKREYRHSYRTNCNISVKGNFLKVPKLKPLRFKGYKEILGKILHVVIKQEPSGKFFAVIVCDSPDLPNSTNTTVKSVGIDMGIKTYVTLSNGTKYTNPKFYEKDALKIAKLNRELARKTKGSSNWQKARIKLARAHEKIRNKRADWQHKLALLLVNSYDVLCIEDLGVLKLLQQSPYAKYIADASWAEFIQKLTYKAAWRHKSVKIAEAYFPSSQLCSTCGHRNTDIADLSIRNWVCPKCGTSHDRDVNAAINVMNICLN